MHAFNSLSTHIIKFKYYDISVSVDHCTFTFKLKGIQLLLIANIK